MTPKGLIFIMKDIDSTKVADIIRHVAETEVMPRFRNLAASDIREKNPGDLVTVADEAAERKLTQLLQDFLPGALVVGEEAVSADPSVLERLKDDKPVWIIDPVDGTTNFSKGSEKFGMLVALVQNGVTHYGWAFDAPGNRMAVAHKGAGAFMNGEKISVSCDATDMGQLVIQYDGVPASHVEPVRPLFQKMPRQGCCLHDHMDFLTGAVNAVVYFDRVTPWDHAAVNLLTTEAGGVVAIDDGKPCDPTRYGRAFMLAAADEDWWQKLHRVLYPLRFS